MKKKTALVLASLLFGAACPGAQAQVNVLTQHNDNARTGQNLKETTLTPANVNVARFGKLFERPVDSNIWSQPLYVQGVSIPNKGTRNVVYVQTEVGQVYAFDADNASETAPLWRRDLAPNDFSDSLSTPVIDLASRTIYLVVRRVNRRGTTDTADDQYSFTFHGLDITTGQDKFAQKTIAGSVAGTGKGSVNGRLSFRADTQKQRPALLLLNGIIYAAFGGGIYEYEPEATWNGWIFGFEAGTGNIKIIYAVSPDRNGGGIWQAANGLASDGTHIYTVTANGGNNPLATSSHQGGRDYGNSTLKLTPNSAKTALSVSDFWTPWDFLYMETADQDLGSSGPLLIPGTNLLMTGDKTSRMYILNKNNMGKFTQGRNNIVQDVLGWRGHLHGGPVYWDSNRHGPVVYGWAEHDFVRAFKVLGDQGLQTNPFMKSSIQVPPGMPGGMLSLSANGGTNGILWATAPYIGDANVGIVPGVLHAFNADNLGEELWNSETFSSRDTVGYFAKFAPPTVANGKVYVPSFYNPANFNGAKLIVYGLLPGAARPAAPTNLRATAGMSKVQLAWNAVSGATSYTVYRGTAAGNTNSVLVKNLRTTSYEDREVTSGTRYFYTVIASNSGGDSAKSNEANATPYAPNNGSIISVNFIGGGSNGTPQAMGPTEKAGVVAASDWNSVAGGSGTLNNLRALGGSPSTASLEWRCDGYFSNTFAETAGNNRMMKGYLSNSGTNSTTVTVRNIPTAITSVGYDVYVYVDGNNPTATRRATFAIGSNTQAITDSQNRDYEGVFVPRGVDDVGNFLVFPNLTGSSFTLTGNPAGSTDGARRAPINGIQIVARRNVTSQQPSAPTNLITYAGNNQVVLSWTGVDGASSYNIKRATNQNGPFNVIGTGVTSTGFGDVTARNGVTYYYMVSAIVGGVESANSNIAAAIPSSSYVGRIISMDFGGGSTPAMASGEMAGADGVVRGFWNSTLYPTGGLGDLKDDTGTVTTTDVTWSSGGVGDTSIAASDGSRKMMRGYIFPGSTPATVNVYNLPSTFTTKGYDVYVYFDNNNGGARTGRYTIGGRTWTGTDAANTNFSGTFNQAVNNTGNFVKLMGLSGSSFTLTATHISSPDGQTGAPINGIQIVSRNYPARGFSLTPPTRSSVAGVGQRMFTAEYRDANGNADFQAARILVNSSPTWKNGLLAHYNARNNLLYLINAKGGFRGGYAPGTPAIISTQWGNLNCAQTSVIRRGNRLVVNWALTVKEPLVGKQNVYIRATDQSGFGAPWARMGTWNVRASSSISAGLTKPSEEKF